MTSLYSVVKYLPDPVADESINIGVVAFGDEGPQFRFVQNLNRAKLLGDNDVSFLRDFIESVRDGRVGALGDPKNWNQESLSRLLGKWHNVIQFTPPRASGKSVGPLIEDLSKLFLKGSSTEGAAEGVTTQGRSYAVRLSKSLVVGALTKRWGQPVARELVKSGHTLAGSAGAHEFDVAIVNGSAYLAARAISFRVQDTQTLRTKVDAAAFAVTDLAERQAKIDTALLVLPPRSREQEAYKRALAISKKKKMKMLEADEFKAWVSNVVSRLPEKVAVHAASTS
jgi:hypothetical protein